MTAAFSLYVYYRIDDGAAAQARTALARHFAALAARGLAGSASRKHGRDERHPGTTTWMERYDAIAPEAIDDAVARVAESARDTGLHAYALDGRHVEVFEHD